MEIQKILFPEVGRCTETELYFRLNRKTDYLKNEFEHLNVCSLLESGFNAYSDNEKRIEFHIEDKTFTLEKNAKVWFDTYFNGLSIEKWMKYTILDNVSLRLELLGKFRVTLVSKEKIHEDIISKVISEKIVESTQKTTFEFPYTYGDKKGMYTFEIEALQDGSVFYGGAYISNVPQEKIRNIKIGICICTFRREAFIEKNLRILNETILKNEESPLNDHLEVFVADNGKTLDAAKLATDKIHINPNKNLGGAGGFTRDLIEIMTHNETLQVTHALLMDDDIVIEPEALVKTYNLLSLLKEEYVEGFIGGAMLRIDKQTIQVESGATWNGGWLNSLKQNLDLKGIEACLYNEMEEYAEYNAWWYCCFPMKIVQPDNLPLPIFIRGDDLEYGLRNMKNLILMNGICVWHEPFENKYSSFLEYYIMRNQLIDNSFHCQWYGAKQLCKAIIGECFRETSYYRYKNVDLYLQGIKDFLKGPQWLMQQDGEELHKKVMAAGYRGQELNTLDMGFSYSEYNKSRLYVDNKSAKFKRMLTLNGILKKAKGTAIVPMSGARPALAYGKKKVMYYDVTSKKAFVCEKSTGKSLACIFKALGLCMIVPFKIKKAQEAYRTEGMKLRTLAFWNEFLGLGENE
jgi:GT2 family glycosyltransferase